MFSAATKTNFKTVINVDNKLGNGRPNAKHGDRGAIYIHSEFVFGLSSFVEHSFKKLMLDYRLGSKRSRTHPSRRRRISYVTYVKESKAGGAEEYLGAIPHNFLEFVPHPDVFQN
jgi:hypothetical protein